MSCDKKRINDQYVCNTCHRQWDITEDDEVTCGKEAAAMQVIELVNANDDIPAIGELVALDFTQVGQGSFGTVIEPILPMIDNVIRSAHHKLGMFKTFGGYYTVDVRMPDRGEPYTPNRRFTYYYFDGSPYKQVEVYQSATGKITRNRDAVEEGWGIWTHS